MSCSDNCKCCVREGGPAIREVECKSCGKKWNRYFGGSWDWEYKDCSMCRVTEMLYESN